MEILKRIKIVDLAILVQDNLIIADTHIGYEEALNKQGVLIPRFQFKEIIERLERILSECGNKSAGGWGTSKHGMKRQEGLSPQLNKKMIVNDKDNNEKNLLNNTNRYNENFNNKKNNDSNSTNKKFNKIIINGDIKHEFGRISDQEWRHTLKLLDFLGKYCNEIILIKGNHDKILGPIADKRNVKIVDFLVIGDILITHGDKEIDKKSLKNIKTIIIGHEHPAISLKDGPRVELFKCFLKGSYKNKKLIVQPSFNLITEGTDILKEKLLSPFLKQRLDDFEVYVVADKVYRFGKVKTLS